MGFCCKLIANLGTVITLDIFGDDDVQRPPFRPVGNSALRALVSGYGLSLRDLKEMMAERGISVDNSTIHRWVVHFSPLILERFNRKKRTVTGKWHADETYIKVRGQWMYLYRAMDSVGDTVEFWFSQRRDLLAARRFFRKAIERHGRPRAHCYRR